MIMLSPTNSTTNPLYESLLNNTDQIPSNIMEYMSSLNNYQKEHIVESVLKNWSPGKFIFYVDQKNQIDHKSEQAGKYYCIYDNTLFFEIVRETKQANAFASKTYENVCHVRFDCKKASEKIKKINRS